MFDKSFKLFGIFSIADIIAILSIIFIAYIFTLSSQILVEKSPHLQAVTIIIFAITALIGILSYRHQLNDRDKMFGIQYANLTQSKINEIEKMFMNNPYLNRLYYQMYQSDPNIMKIVEVSGHSNSYETPEILKAEHHASNMIFQAIGDIYACELINVKEIDCVEWLHTFKKWLQSEVLIKHWKSLQNEQHPDVRKLINSLIK